MSRLLRRESSPRSRLSETVCTDSLANTRSILRGKVPTVSLDAALFANSTLTGDSLI